MTDDTLKDYYRAIHRLREALENDLHLDSVDRMTLENFMVVMPMTYKNFKRRNPDDWGPPALDPEHRPLRDRFSSLPE